MCSWRWAGTLTPARTRWLEHSTSRLMNTLLQIQNVCLEALAYLLPAERVSSGQIEQRLEPLYRRLGLVEGRLEAMTGIAERRLWPAEALPSDTSAQVACMAMEAAHIDPSQIGLLVHGSVCRDRLEPATACRVHHLAGLSPECLVYDVSNACLGLLNGMLQAAALIELGAVQAALVVGTENSRSLLESTIRWLVETPGLDRQAIKPAMASLTIGSAACAVLLTHRTISRTDCGVGLAVWRAESAQHRLCQSGPDDAVGLGMQPLMDTDSEALLAAGIEAGKATFGPFVEQLQRMGWPLQATICHQVGSAHRRAILKALQLDPQSDYITYPYLGNTGSVALPLTLAVAAEKAQLVDQQIVGLLGIGSGVNCLMMACRWGPVAVYGRDLAAA
ncbi:MAG: 3-oxoacyl-ACP synthase III [Pirellulaceae bacterium]|nr:MAG: 3-oxoacyl-ACP synthase III [Pirellulaceae bacterium]